MRICNVPDYGIEEVADHAAAMTLALASQTGALRGRIRSGRWEIDQMVDGVRSLRDTTVGLIGLGRIARAYATRMAVFGCRIIGFDPYVTETEARSAGIEPLPQDKVIASAHILSLHVPLTPETRDLIDTTAIARMPEGAILINCARGGLVNEVALIEALTRGHLSGPDSTSSSKNPPG